MGTFHENLLQSFHNFRDKYLKANNKYFKFSYDSTSGKYGYTIDGVFHPFKRAHTGTFVASSRGAALDMGEDHENRYVNTNSVPNSNSGTQTISAVYESGNGYDMGATNTKRYIKTSGLMKTPTATKSITGNGSNIDVLNYAKANVSVSVSSVTATVINSKAQLVSNITIYDAIVGAYYILGTDYGWGGTGWEFVADIPIVSAGSFGSCILARATSTTVVFTPYMDNPNRKFDATMTRLNISLS